MSAFASSDPGRHVSRLSEQESMGFGKKRFAIMSAVKLQSGSDHQLVGRPESLLADQLTGDDPPASICVTQSFSTTFRAGLLTGSEHDRQVLQIQSSMMG